MLRWTPESLLDLPCAQIGEHYGRYRLHQPEAERAMARSLDRYGQLSPVVVCQRAGHYELIDGFKRLGAARGLASLSHLWARVMEADDRAAKAAIYGPWACRPRHPQTKGKIERPFGYIEKNLLNGRTFTSLEHLNEVTATWLATTADLHNHKETKRRPLDLYWEEKPHLLPLPAYPYDTAETVYRTVNSEGQVAYRQNFYSVPWQRIGELLPVRITEKELIIYGPDVTEIARHELYPSAITGEKHRLPAHSPGRDPQQKYQLLKQRFAEFGAEGILFFEQLVKARRYGKEEASRVLALLSTYRREDLQGALERAARYRAFSLPAVERILAAQARPHLASESLADEAREHLAELFQQAPVSVRPTEDYQEQELLKKAENENQGENPIDHDQKGDQSA